MKTPAKATIMAILRVTFCVLVKCAKGFSFTLFSGSILTFSVYNIINVLFNIMCCGNVVFLRFKYSQ